MTTDVGKKIGSQVQSLARNGIALAAGGVAAQVVFTLLEIVVARKLGAEVYGVFVTAYAWTIMGSFILELGTPWWIVQDGSRHPEKLPVLLGSSLTVNFVVFALLYLLLAAVTRFIPGNTVLDFMLILLPYGLILTLQNVLGAVYSSYQTMHVNAFFQGIAPLFILAVYFVCSANGLSLADVGIAYVTGGAMVTAIWLVLTVRRIRPRTALPNIIETLRSSYQYGLSGILGHVYFKSDIILLSALAGLHEAGIYAAAFKLVELVFKVAVLSGRVFAPAIFKASHEVDKSFSVLSSMMLRLLTVVGLVAGVVSFVLADDLMRLMFGDAFAPAIPVLRILSGVMAAKCMMVALQMLLSSIDLHFQRVANLGVTIVAHIAANVILIPRFGALGAAWATLFSGALVIFLYAWSASRKHDFQFLRWVLVPSCLAGAVAIAAYLSGINAFAGAAIAIAVLLIGLLLIGFVRRDEIRFVFQSVLATGSG